MRVQARLVGRWVLNKACWGGWRDGKGTMMGCWIKLSVRLCFATMLVQFLFQK